MISANSICFLAQDPLSTVLVAKLQKAQKLQRVVEWGKDARGEYRGMYFKLLNDCGMIYDLFIKETVWKREIAQLKCITARRCWSLGIQSSNPRKTLSFRFQITSRHQRTFFEYTRFQTARLYVHVQKWHILMPCLLIIHRAVKLSWSSLFWGDGGMVRWPCYIEIRA